MLTCMTRTERMTEFRAMSEYRPVASLGTGTFSSSLARSQGLGNSCSLLAPGPEKVIVWQKQEA